MSKHVGMANTRTFVILLVVVAVVVAIFAVVRLDTTGERGSGLGRAFVYDIDELAKIDANLILYEESGETVTTWFEASRAIAVDSADRIYVAGDEAVRIFTGSGASRGEIKLSDKPRCLTVADEGRIYIGMKEHVEVYSRRHKKTATWPSLGSDAVLTSIAVSKNDVFVADAGNGVVIHCDTDGRIINHIGRRDGQAGTPHFVIPSPYFDLAVAPDGLLRVVNPGRLRIEAFTFDGDLEFTWGKFSSNLEGFTGCCNPVNIAILADGSFVTCEKGLVRVKIYDPDGAFVGVVAGPRQLVEGRTLQICYFPAQCQAGGFDVAVDSTGRVFVLDTIRNIVRVFSRTGTQK